jgi:toxin-antitoxin system PIN domain toxin
VIIVDANVLIHAVNADAREHEAARTWLDRALDGAETVGFAWIVLLAFLRLTTNRSVFPTALETSQAGRIVRDWLERPAAQVVEPGPRHLALLTALLEERGSAANLVNDAHLAALAIEYAATVVSFDGDFEGFPGLRWSRPGA